MQQLEFSKLSHCKKENIFIKNFLSTQSTNSIFYAFNSQTAKNAVQFATNLNDDNNITLSKVLFMNDYVNMSIGVISATLLNQICGPYPTFSELYNDLFDYIIHTYLLPILMIFVLITNFFVCLVLSKPQMRSPVFFLLFLIGIIELINCCLPLPMYIAQSIYKRTAWWTNLPMKNFTMINYLLNNTNWELAPNVYYQTSDNIIASEASAWTTVFLPTITHTISVWLTIALALQRVINLTTFNLTSKLCNLSSTGKIFIIISCMAIILHWPLLSSRFILFQPIQLKSYITKNSLYDNEKLNSIHCLLNIVDNLPHIVMKCHLIKPVYMIFYFYARIVLIHLLPCGILIGLTIILVIKMHSIIKLRTRLGLRQKMNTHSIINNNNNTIYTSTTKKPSINPQAISRMLIVVLLKFIAMHLPNAIVLTIYVLRRMWKVENFIQTNNEETLLETTTTTTTATTTTTTEGLDNKQIYLTFEYNYTINQSINLLDTKQNIQFNKINNHNITDDYLGKAVLLCNLVILVSYQLNFVIYYIMSTQFKETFNNLYFIKYFTMNRN
ncbi:unnamed protein product [Schistosoma margrebowiei]|uniref:G_PROTEIN_RECEP_F1_2 domain-containing protein n=1 Tax=Schistosoma margrebowiei TaxID=48269 RepID=A0AA84ZQY5_9TREM|nr:unnamed protein product [Schistosoma margrebowiei]